MIFSRWVACVLPLLAACASVSPLPAAPLEEEETISLRFDWEPGSTAQVDAVRSTVGWTPRGSERQQISLRYSLAAEASPGEEALASVEPAAHPGREGELLVRRIEVNIEKMPTLSEARSIEMVALELAQPDLRVNGLGNLVGIGEQARAQAVAASLLGRLARSGPVPESFKGRLQELFTDQGIQRRAASAWDELVGLWSGGDLEVGRVYHARDRMAVDALGGIGLEMLYEMSLLGRVPCEAGEPDAACVELELIARPEPSQRARLLAFVSTLFPYSAQDVEIEERIVLTTEPRTLRPHRFSARRSVVIPFAPEEGRSPPRFEQIDEQLLHFEWAGPATGAR